MPKGAEPSQALGLVDPDGPISLPLNLNMVPEFPIQVVEQDERYVVLTDEFGVTKKMLRRTSSGAVGTRQQPAR
jgi:hypothetical protein